MNLWPKRSSWILFRSLLYSCNSPDSAMLRSIYNKSHLLFCSRIAKSCLLAHSCNGKVQTNLPVCISQHSFWSGGNKKSEEGLITVYVGQQESKVYRVKTFSVCSSLLGILAQPILMQKIDTMGHLILANTFVGFFTFVTPVLLHLVTKKYVTRVEYNPKTDMYTATLVTFFLTERKVTFGPGEAEVPDLPRMFTTFKIRGVPMLVDICDFDVEHYARILGYDKPLNYKLPSDDETEPAGSVTSVNVPKTKKVE